MSITIIHKRCIDLDVINAVSVIGAVENIPSIEELRRYSLLHPELELRVLIVMVDQACVGLSVCFVAQDRVNGVKLRTYRLLGYKLYDYNGVYFQLGYFQHLLNAMRVDAADSCSDLILLDNVPYLIEEFGRKFLVEEHVLRVFNSKICADGYQYILSKKKARRDFNKIKRSLNYSVSHQFGNFSELDIDALGKLHIERWGFDGVDSAFSTNSQRFLEYCSFKDNKVLTIIRDGSEIVACHFGIVYGQSILWHTPVINIKYLQYSPLKILLMEVMDYCIQNNLPVFDLGLGDEDYKERFSNEDSSVYQYYFPVSLKGHLSLSIKRHIDTSSIKHLIGRFAHKTNQILKLLFKSQIAFFICNELVNSTVNSQYKFNIVNDFSNFVDLMRLNKFDIKFFQYERFKSGDSYVFLSDNLGKILSYGWVTDQSIHHFVSAGRGMDLEGRSLMHDFEISVLDQSNMYFSELIKHVAVHFSGNLAILCLNKNKNIINEIALSGFTKSKPKFI